MKISKHLISTALLFASLVPLSNCGGGGGDDEEFIGAAQVSLQVSPHKIDTGDRTELKIDISRIHQNGIALKIKFPKGLEYVPSSSFLTVREQDEDVSPTVNQGKESDVYLVYYITKDQIGRDDFATLFLELEGTDGVEDGSIEIDPDVDDPAIDNAVEFNIDEPQFGSEEEASIEVTE